MLRQLRWSILAGVVVVLGIGPSAEANLLLNGAFQSGNLTDWTTFTTSNGTTGAGFPTVVSFNTTGSGAQNSAQFDVGQVNFVAGDFEGGGLSQSFSTAGGTLTLAADIASQNPNGAPNASGGLFQLLLDGSVVASFNIGVINPGQTIMDHLSDTITGVTAGSHTFAVEITRPFLSGSGSTPLEYFTNADVEALTAVPEPSTLLVAGWGCIGFLVYAWRRRRTAV